MANDTGQDNVQHGIDDDPHDDGKKALGLGAVGGGTVGAMAGMAAGPLGALIGAAIGGTIGSLASGAAVDAVDQIDNDDTVSGLGTDSADTRYANANTSGMSGASGTPVPGTDAYAAMAQAQQEPQASTTASSVGTTTGLTESVTPVSTTGASGASASRAGEPFMTNNSEFDPNLHVGTLGTPPNQRHLTRAEYDALNENDRMKVVLMAEQLNVQKEARQAGEVTISTHVVEEQVQVPVTLQHEEVTVTRHKVDGPVDPDLLASGQVFQDQTIKVPVHEEVANVTKTARVAEEIEIDKRAVSEQRTVSDTVRHEELDINTPSNVRLTDTDK